MVGDHPDGEIKIIVTVYEADPNLWEKDFIRIKTV